MLILISVVILLFVIVTFIITGNILNLTTIFRADMG